MDSPPSSRRRASERSTAYSGPLTSRRPRTSTKASRSVSKVPIMFPESTSQSSYHSRIHSAYSIKSSDVVNAVGNVGCVTPEREMPLGWNLGSIVTECSLGPEGGVGAGLGGAPGPLPQAVDGGARLHPAHSEPAKGVPGHLQR